MTTSFPRPRRGEIWLCNFDTTIGAEIKKIRPAVVVSSDGVGKLPIKLVAPITDWKEYYAGNIWHIKIEPDSTTDILHLLNKLVVGNAHPTK